MKRICVFALLFFCVCAAIMAGNLPIKVYALPEVIIEAKSAVLVDYKSGEILFSQNSDEKLEIASMVKLMTIYLTIEAIENGDISLEDTLVASVNASSMGGSQVFIDEGASYSVEKMLQSVIMASANDASVALSEYICGTEKAFVEKMNQKAKEFGMHSTQYANATGLPAPMQFSTAKDTAIILSKLVQNPIYHKYSSVWIDELVHPSGRKTELVNTNKLTRYYKGCDCGKTGFTDEAGYCLASSATKGDMRLIAVVMGAKTAKTRFNESVKLLNYGFSNFQSVTVLDSTLPQGEITVLRSNENKASVFAKESFSTVCKIGEKPMFDIHLDIKKSVTAPMQKDDIVGLVTISKEGKVIKEIPLVLKEDINSLTFKEAYKKAISAW